MNFRRQFFFENISFNFNKNYWYNLKFLLGFILTSKLIV